MYSGGPWESVGLSGSLASNDYPQLGRPAHTSIKRRASGIYFFMKLKMNSLLPTPQKRGYN